jgi:hypothetical protein
MSIDGRDRTVRVAVAELMHGLKPVSAKVRGSARTPPPVFAPGEGISLERGERSKRARLTGATGVVVDGAARLGWLRVRVGGETLRWHQRDLRRLAVPIELLRGDALVLVLDRMGCHRSLAAAASVCREWRVVCREPSLWHTVDFLSFPNAVGYVLHLIDVRARLRHLRVDYNTGVPEDPRVVCWLLRACDTRQLEIARVAAITGLASRFACERSDDLGDGTEILIPTGGSLAHLEALLALPSLHAERRKRVSRLLAEYSAVIDEARDEPVLSVLVEQAPSLRSLDAGKVVNGAFDATRGLASLRDLVCLRVIFASDTYGGERGTTVKARAETAFKLDFLEVLATLPKLRSLALGGWDASYAVAIRSQSLETLDLSGLTKSVFLTEVKCPRLTRVLHQEDVWYGSGIFPFIFATDLNSRQTVRVRLLDNRHAGSDSDGYCVEPDGYGFPVDEFFRRHNPAYRHLPDSAAVTALWEFAHDYDGSGHAKAAVYWRFLQSHRQSRSRHYGRFDGALDIEQLSPTLGLEECDRSAPRLEVLRTPYDDH